MKCNQICAGSLRHKISLQQYILYDDGMGGQQEIWDEYAEVWARISPLSGTEAVVGMQLQDSISHDILLRYRDDVKAKHRVVYEGREFNIRSVIDIEERKRFLQLRCEEGVAQ